MPQSTGDPQNRNQMKNKPTTYSRFYALLAQMAGDREQVKETLVSRFTSGRTTSLRNMKASEYDAMCEAMEAEIKHPGMSDAEYHRELKRMRSAALHRMQKMGIDTADWGEVDRFCSQPRIAGKQFYKLCIADLKALMIKLEAMRRKNYTAQRIPKIPIPIFVNPNILPS